MPGEYRAELVLRSLTRAVERSSVVTASVMQQAVGPKWTIGSVGTQSSRRSGEGNRGVMVEDDEPGGLRPCAEHGTEGCICCTSSQLIMQISNFSTLSAETICETSNACKSHSF